MKLSLLALVAVLAGCAPLHFVHPSNEQLAFDLAEKNVELVDMKDPTDPHVYCSGEWVSPNEILTADHCTHEAVLGEGFQYAVQSDVATTLDGKTVIAANKARLEIRDKDHDLALLVADDAPAHGVAELSFDDIRAGQVVHAMGNPVGQGWSFSSGEVARVRWISGIGDEDASMWYVQATAPISPGSSGGGLYNAYGQLIGVARASFRRGQNVNLFIHRDHIAAFLLNAHAGR